MENRTDILRTVEAYCAMHRIAPSTLALRVMSNARFFDRFTRRLGADPKSVEKICACMTGHPDADDVAAGCRQGIFRCLLPHSWSMCVSTPVQGPESAFGFQALISNHSKILTTGGSGSVGAPS